MRLPVSPPGRLLLSRVYCILSLAADPTVGITVGTCKLFAARCAAIARLLPASVHAYAKAKPNGNGQNANVLTNRNVIDLVKSGLPEAIIAAKVTKTGGRFDTSTDALKGLKATGVPDAVILAMVQA